MRKIRIMLVMRRSRRWKVLRRMKRVKSSFLISKMNSGSMNR
jgi:hypothetical protein